MSDEQDTAIRNAHKVLREEPGLRRILRRIEDSTAALYHQGTHTALAHLKDAGMSDKDGHALEALLLLSHIDADVPGRLGHQFRGSGPSPTISRERFRRLADADRGEALRQLRYMVQQCKGRVSVVDLAWTAYHWGKDRRDGSTVPTAKERLALDYYSTYKTKEDTE